ncbi:hypothetical protein HDA40_008084 [Hamadaea flava]|uniref:DUF6297 family protein n=1 Tax=Hamadaea flava TaxID=1742688 RepID=A0ABV8LLG8_9ACTN|nr:DUF6297 family protein [Hamadaea flava]MCP2329577.1 hypothetical protein [Hamadaea flava]
MTAFTQARRLTRAHRSAGTLVDRYTILFGVTVAFGLIAAPLLAVVRGLSSGQAHPERTVLAASVVLLAVTGLTQLARVVGPLVLPPSDAHWLLLSPLPRRAVLTRIAVSLAASATVVGSAVGLTALAVVGTPNTLTTGAAAVTGASTVLILAVATVSWQATRAAWPRIALGAAFAVGEGSAIAWALGLRTSPPSPSTGIVVLATLVLLSLATSLSWYAWRRLRGFPAAAVVDASQRLGSAADATIGLEPFHLSLVAEDRYWVARRLRSRGWPRLRPPWAVALADARLLARRPGRLAVLAAAVAWPALLAVMISGRHIAVILLLGAGTLTAAAAGLAALRRDIADPALRQMLGIDPTAVDAARLVLPGLLGGGWLTAALICGSVLGVLPPGPWWVFGPLAAPAVAVAARRLARRGPIDHTSTLVVMPMTGSQLPTGWLLWTVKGLDVAVGGTLPVLLALATGQLTVPWVGAQLVASALVLAVAIRSR